MPLSARKRLIFPDSMPEPAASSLSDKLFSEPFWLWGVFVGGLAALVLLLGILPRQDYARPLRDPVDAAALTREAALSPEVADELARARRALAKGQVEAAVQALLAVTVQAPEALEARWLLATTYDRLGDTVRAAREYQAYVALAAPRHAALGEHLAEARRRLEAFREMP